MSLFRDRPNFRPFVYNPAEIYTARQRKVFWIPEKISLTADIQEYHVSFNEGIKHAITTSLQLFTHYEVGVGDFWAEIVYPRCKPHEVQMMAAMFSAMELAVHAIFYDRLNDELGLSTKEFYMSYQSNSDMVNRMELINHHLRIKNNQELPLAMALFSFIEGVVLYSSFSFLMSFQANGMNKLSNVVTGLKYSVRDENLHAEAGSWLFNTLVTEGKADRQKVYEELVPVLKILVAQEDAIIDEMFSKGGIKHMTADHLKTFVRHRTNKKLEDIQMKPIYEVDEGENPIADWFYDMINAKSMNDFFHNESVEYEETANFTNTTYKVWHD